MSWGEAEGRRLGSPSEAASKVQKWHHLPPQAISFLFFGKLSPALEGKKKTHTFALLFSLCTETLSILDPNPLSLLPVSTGKVIVPPCLCDSEGYEAVTVV